MREWREYLPWIGHGLIYDLETDPEPTGVYVYWTMWKGFVFSYYPDPAFHSNGNPFLFCYVPAKGKGYPKRLFWFGKYSKWGHAKCT